MFKILTLNNIADVGLSRLPGERYEVSSDQASPDGIILRSFKMHDMEIADSLGVSVGTSKSQLHRARMLMRQHLG